MVLMSNALTVGFQANAQGFNCITSIQVADLFGREHKHVLRNIAKLVEEEGLGESICGLSSYPSAQKKPLPQYLLTEAGFAILISSFNLRSKKDREIRNTVLTRFQERSQRLISRNLQLEQARAKRNASLNQNGYIVVPKGNTGEETTKMVPKDEHSEEDLLEGGILRRESQIGGLRKGINKAKARLKEIRNPLKLVK
jgi:Rha family phage regulatory protein